MADRVLVEYKAGPRKGQRAWMNPTTAAKPDFAAVVEVVGQRQRSKLGNRIVPVGLPGKPVPTAAPARPVAEAAKTAGGPAKTRKGR